MGHVFNLKTVTLLILIIALIYPVSAQEQSTQCVTIVEQSLSILRDTCNAVDNNQGCYATGEIPESLTEQAQAFDLTTITELSTSAVNLENNEIGTALLKVQSADASIYMFLIGETTVVNHSEEDLPPFQNFFMSTTASGTDCATFDAIFAVYVPPEQTASLTMNGVEMTLQGLMTAQWLSANSLEVVVHQGILDVVDNAVITSGMAVSAVTDAGEVLALSAAYPADASHTQRGMLIANTINAMLNTDVEVVEITETPTEQPEPTEAPQETAQCQDQIHTVSSGENLYRISLRYGVSQNSIISANQIANPDRINVGQQLVIPCDSGQTTSAPVNTTAPITNNTPTTTAPITNNEAAQFCASFNAVTPIGGYPQQLIDLYNQLCR